MRFSLCLILLATAACGGAPSSGPAAEAAAASSPDQLYLDEILGVWGETPACEPDAIWTFREDSLAAPGRVDCWTGEVIGGSGETVRILGTNCHREPLMHGDIVVDLTLTPADELRVTGVYQELAPSTLTRCPS